MHGMVILVIVSLNVIVRGLASTTRLRTTYRYAYPHLVKVNQSHFVLITLFYSKFWLAPKRTSSKCLRSASTRLWSSSGHLIFT